jgi:hypothetical protein
MVSVNAYRVRGAKDQISDLAMKKKKRLSLLFGPAKLFSFLHSSLSERITRCNIESMKE